MNQWPWPAKYQFENLSLLGNTLAGQGTSFLCPEHKIAFDVAFGLPYLLGARDFFISHAHMDHAGGMPYLISQQNLMSLPKGRFYLPESACDPIEEILKLWQKIEGHEYDYELNPVRAGQWIELKKDFGIRPFKTIHRVESFGYTLFQKQKKLKSEFENVAPKDLAKLRHQGEVLEDVFDTPLVSFTGDTQIEFIDSEPWVKESRLLIVEVTYMEGEKSIEKARQWGHIHLDELLERLPELKCQKILLIHLSARHRVKDLEAHLSRRLPNEWQGRVDVFPRDGIKPK